jgi:hypothetical protein
MSSDKLYMKKLLIISALMAGIAGVQADDSVFQASLTPDSGSVKEVPDVPLTFLCVTRMYNQN